MKKLLELLILHVGVESQYICISLERMEYRGVLTHLESERLLFYIRDNKPSPIQHTEFYNNPSFTKEADIHDAWWNRANTPKDFRISTTEALAERKRFIQHLIDNCKETQ